MTLTEPLWTELDAALRAQELCELFKREPETLSPDEQALAMTLLTAIGLLGRANDHIRKGVKHAR